ncbi:MAG: hypothetical protein UU69_C0014G0022 [Candidatus Magasanikbacteria bacterium GW2011_GWA2_41_55]|uniref:Uncharacterized protein n=1 Tax=Candidatus Magasanikbacteria bacterium GW2011_GWA2_41_55 TaxID=1619038 RepID=A0A0G0ZJD0_9BACT|nr:MAG: hypothetical protein UU69_C0014G0022 [Candidatus Magasanikbacteria bacterium GW2011_GWA2_41_55]
MRDLQKIKISNLEESKKRAAENITAYNKHRSQLARARWAQTQKKTEKEIGRMSLRELKLIGAALYWAEGYKRGNWNIVFCNSDFLMMKIMMKFFKEVCHVPLTKIKIQIQIHHNVSDAEARKYWMKKLHLSDKYFLKTMYQVSKSSQSKYPHRLPFGTARIKINDVVLVNRVKGWISGLAGSI